VRVERHRLGVEVLGQTRVEDPLALVGREHQIGRLPVGQIRAGVLVPDYLRQPTNAMVWPAAGVVRDFVPLDRIALVVEQQLVEVELQLALAEEIEFVGPDWLTNDVREVEIILECRFIRRDCDLRRRTDIPIIPRHGLQFYSLLFCPGCNIPDVLGRNRWPPHRPQPLSVMVQQPEPVLLGDVRCRAGAGDRDGV